MNPQFATDVVNVSGALVVLAAAACVVMAVGIVIWACLDGTD